MYSKVQTSSGVCQCQNRSRYVFEEILMFSNTVLMDNIVYVLVPRKVTSNRYSKIFLRGYGRQSIKSN